jgi:ABC-2 type transport system permease protein
VDLWRPRPPGWPWLLAHEVRLGWRSSGIRSPAMIILAAILLALGHVVAWAFMRAFDLEALLARAAPLVIASSIFVVLLIVSAAFGIAAHVLFQRGDLDLVLSSPVPVAHVYAVRAMYVGIGSVATVGIFLLPLANVAPLHGHWQVLLAYPVLAAVGLASAAIALAASLALVRAFGVRRARVLAQVTGAIVGAALMILSQAYAFLPRGTQARVSGWVRSEPVAWWLSPESPLAWPFRAAAGDFIPAAVVILASLAVYVALIRSTADSFASSAQQAPEAARLRVDGGAPARAFRSGLARVVIAKELKLVARDPTLISQALLQVIYLLPLFLVLVRKAQAPALLGAGLVMLAMSITGSLAWVAVSGEEAPDLLGSAPVSLERLRWLKVLAAIIPVAVVVSPFLAWFALDSLRDAIALLACLAGGVISSAMVQIWTARSDGKRDLRLRYKQSLFVNLAELLSSAGWATACYMAMSGTGGALWALPLALASPAVAWITAWRRRRA